MKDHLGLGEVPNGALKIFSGINGVRNTQRTPACTVQSKPKTGILPATPTPGPAYTFQCSPKLWPISPWRFNVLLPPLSQLTAHVATARLHHRRDQIVLRMVSICVKCTLARLGSPPMEMKSSAVT